MRDLTFDAVSCSHQCLALGRRKEMGGIQMAAVTPGVGEFGTSPDSSRRHACGEGWGEGVHEGFGIGKGLRLGGRGCEVVCVTRVCVEEYETIAGREDEKPAAELKGTSNHLLSLFAPHALVCRLC